MNDFVNWLLRWTARVFVIVVGAVFFLCLLAMASVLVTLWVLRAMWAKLTGQPVMPWVHPMRGVGNWQNMYRRRTTTGEHPSGPSPSSAVDDTAPAGTRRSGILPKMANDITDVKPREIHEG